MRCRVRFVILLSILVGYALPAQAAVSITFWSHELGNSFPHAFFTLRGTPDTGGAQVDANFGFTAKSVTPALLIGPVAGMLDIARPSYIAGSDAQFSVAISDAQYDAVLRLVDAWREGKPDSVYRLGTHNCVHFVKEAARLVGLSALDQPALMKKPRSYLKAVLAGNSTRVTRIGMRGKAYLASLPGPVPPVGTMTARSVNLAGADRGIVSITRPPPLPSASR